MRETTRRELLKIGAGTLLSAGLGAGSEGITSAKDIPKRVGGAQFKIGCCAYSYRKYLQAKTNPITLYDFLDICAELKLDGVELTSYYFPQPLTAAKVHKLARRVFLLGLDVAGAAVGNTFCLPPGPERDKNIALVKQWIGYAVDMGAPCLRVFAGALPKGTEEGMGRKWVVECLETCLPFAEEKGVMLAMENHGGVVADAAGTLAILEAVKSDWFGLKWDSYNYHTADPYADLAKVAPYAITTHIKTEIAPSGKKQPADYIRILSLLKAVQYRGYLHLEYEADEEPKIAIPRAIEAIERAARMV